MSKKIRKNLLCTLIVVCIFFIPLIALAGTSDTTPVPVANSFQGYASCSANSPYVTGSATMTRRDGKAIAVGNVGSKVYLFDATNDTLKAMTKVEYNSSSINIYLKMTAITGTDGYNYQASADLYGWDGSDYVMEKTGKTPYSPLKMAHILSTYGVNEYGQAFGGMSVQDFGIELDLIRAYGINNEIGYVYASDLDVDFIASNPEEAIKYENSKPSSIEIPVYDVDGKTIIDTFVIE